MADPAPAAWAVARSPALPFVLALGTLVIAVVRPLHEPWLVVPWLLVVAAGLTLRLGVHDPARPARDAEDALHVLAAHLLRGRFEDLGAAGHRVTGRVRKRDVTLALDRGGAARATLSTALALPLGLRIEPVRRGSLELAATISDPACAPWAAQLLRTPEVRRPLDALFALHDAVHVEARGGRLVVRTATTRVVPDHLERGLARLVALARALERATDPDPDVWAESVGAPAAPPVRSAPAPEPEAVEAGPAVRSDGPPRCPFCRDPLAGLGAVVECGRCRTLHHEACWQELGRCTATGCTCAVSAPAPEAAAGPARIHIGPLRCTRCGWRSRGCTGDACVTREEERRRDRLDQRARQER